MKKKVSRELQALEQRIKDLKQAVRSRQGNLDYLGNILDSAKTAQELGRKGKGGFPKDIV